MVLCSASRLADPRMSIANRDPRKRTAASDPRIAVVDSRLISTTTTLLDPRLAPVDIVYSFVPRQVS